MEQVGTVSNWQYGPENKMYVNGISQEWKVYTWNKFLNNFINTLLPD